MHKLTATLRFLAYSMVGIVAFFVPLSIDGKSTILMDHIVSFFANRYMPLAHVYTVLLIVLGVGLPFVSGRWRRSWTSVVLSFLQVAALPLTALYFLDRGPAALMQPGMLPFLFEKLAIPVGLIIPVGALFLAFLTGYGLLEAIGRLMEPIMRPVWKTPGRSAIDAVASFAGSYSVGLILTQQVYKSGRYSAREAAVIATGFSTVSVTFMVVVAKTLALTDWWNAWFWSTLLVTFAVSAITVRLPPLRGMDNRRAKPDEEHSEARSVEHGSLFHLAWKEGVEVAGSARPLFTLMWRSIVDGLLMATRVVPSILAIGMLGLLLAKYTPVFDLLGYLLYPFAWLSQVDSPGQVSSALASGLAEMFLPAIQSTELTDIARFTVGIVSVSSILFFSASIPCILATEIPISIWQMVCIWFQRTALSIPLAVGLANLFL